MVDNKIISQVVSALLNQNGGNKTVSKLYGTVEVNDGHKFVKLDGSDTLTAIVEGTEVMAGDRVLVAIENHQAVVLSNITSPASARTATNFMDFTEDGLIIGVIAGTDGSPPQSIVIGSLNDGEEGVYLRVGTTVIAKFIGDENGYSKIEFGPFRIQGSQDEYFAFLDSLGLNIYLNYRGPNIFDAATRIQPGYVAINNVLGNYIEMKNGGVNAENGCNTKVSHVSVSSAATISVNHGSTYSGSIQAVVPVGYTPCGIMKRQILGQPYYFTYLELDSTGKISYTIYNATSSDGTGISVHFTIACALTG